jgi:hypothetical protein
LGLATAALLLGLAGAAHGQTTPSQDVACMVVTMFAANRLEDPKAKEGVVAGFAYYMGRAKAAEPGIDLKARLVAEARTLIADPERLRTEAARCGADMQAWGRETQAIGNALTEEGRRLQGRPPT